MKIRNDDKYIQPTTRFIGAIKRLMKAEILMMRKLKPSQADCWYCGGVRIKDLANSNGMSFQYGGLDDCVDIKTEVDIYIEVPFK